MEKKRSVGVTVIGIVYIILGVFGIFGGLLSVVMFRGTRFDLAMSFIFTVALIVSGCGVLMLKAWGRKLILFYAVFSSAYAVFYTPIVTKRTLPLLAEQYAEKGLPPPSEPLLLITSILPTLIFAGITFYFFTRPKVKRQFINEEGRNPERSEG